MLLCTQNEILVNHFSPKVFHKSIFNIKLKIVDETLITVRGLGTCVGLELQEFARIIFVDDYSTYTPKIEDHEPLAERPSYRSLDNPSKSVS